MFSVGSADWHSSPLQLLSFHTFPGRPLAMLRNIWISWFTYLQRTTQLSRRKPVCFCPALESLEDRLTPSSSITGHTFTDLTGNGLSADDTAKSGVTVRL